MKDEMEFSIKTLYSLHDGSLSFDSMELIGTFILENMNSLSSSVSILWVLLYGLPMLNFAVMY
ncbi:hypothetical protein DMW99_22870 [Pseudomonas chlororaphis]|nr:hypothetical protein C1Y36_28300 [Pseudomonas sp. FW306-2-2C-D06C]PYC33284.1 hypothetical protein DMW99_22870 [Pseudomonas chlororaphis]